jgi:hypothetical protein
MISGHRVKQTLSPSALAIERPGLALRDMRSGDGCRLLLGAKRTFAWRIYKYTPKSLLLSSPTIRSPISACARTARGFRTRSCQSTF